MRDLIDIVEADTPATTKEVAEHARKFLSSHWEAWHASAAAYRQGYDKSGSTSMCRFSCIFLMAVLKAELGEVWAIKGGSPWEPRYPDGGMLSPNGKWESHYWLVNGGTILDITADQFGYDPVIITTVSDKRYKSNYTTKELRQHVKDASQTAGKWLEAYLAP